MRLPPPPYEVTSDDLIFDDPASGWVTAQGDDLIINSDPSLTLSGDDLVVSQ